MTTMIPFHMPKFMRPRLAKHVITRPDVIAKLQDAYHYPLTLITAGAGYGKSTLMNQAFPEHKGRSVWFHVNEQDVSAPVFLFHLICAVQSVFPQAGKNAQEALAWGERQSSAEPLTILQILMSELADVIKEEIVIVLDDFQHIANREDILQLTAAMIELLPSHIHAVIASRERVMLPGLAIRRARGLLLEIEEQDLAFQYYEIMELFLEHYGLDMDASVANRLVQRTEGWIMAIHMLGQHMKKAPPGKLPCLSCHIPYPNFSSIWLKNACCVRPKTYLSFCGIPLI